MKKDTHPAYYPKAEITCACGTTHKVGSTVEKITVDICSNCHPFYTGKQKLVDTARRIEKFEEKIAKKTTASKTRKGKTAKKAALKEKRKTKMAVRKSESKKLGSRRKKPAISVKSEVPKKPETPKKDGSKKNDK